MGNYIPTSEWDFLMAILSDKDFRASVLTTWQQEGGLSTRDIATACELPRSTVYDYVRGRSRDVKCEQLARVVDYLYRVHVESLQTQETTSIESKE